MKREQWILVGAGSLGGGAARRDRRCRRQMNTLRSMEAAHKRAALARALPLVVRAFVATVGFLTSPQGQQVVRVAVGIGGFLAVRLRTSPTAAPSTVDIVRDLYASRGT